MLFCCELQPDDADTDIMEQKMDVIDRYTHIFLQ